MTASVGNGRKAITSVPTEMVCPSRKFNMHYTVAERNQNMIVSTQDLSVLEMSNETRYFSPWLLYAMGHERETVTSRSWGKRKDWHPY